MTDSRGAEITVEPGEKDQVTDPDAPLERRLQRSEDRMEALGLQLKYLKNRLGLEAIVLCDDLGEVVAATGETDRINQLAQQSPWLVATPEKDLPDALSYLWETFPGLQDHHIALRPINTEGDSLGGLIICGVGSSSYLDDWVRRAACGVQRILRQTLN